MSGGVRVQAGIKRSILIQCYRDDLSDVIKVPSLTLGGAYSGTSHNMNQAGIFKLARLARPGGNCISLST